jgi:hypothetical protein
MKRVPGGAPAAVEEAEHGGRCRRGDGEVVEISGPAEEDVRGSVTRLCQRLQIDELGWRADEAAGVVRRDAEEDLLHEIVHRQRRRRAP